jgi:hypothetical protein
MDAGCSLKWFTTSTVEKWLHSQMSITYNFSQLYIYKTGASFVVVMACGCIHMLIHNCRR